MPNSARWTALLLALASCAVASCAGTTVTRIATPEADLTAEGFRYYESSPYVLVYSDGKNGLTTKLLYLPDRTRKMAVEPYGYLASNTTKLNFVNGVLTDSSEKGDSTAIPKAAIDAIKTAAIAAAKGAMNAPGAVGFGVPTPFLYKIVVDSNGVTLRGSQATMPNGKREIRVVRLADK